MSATLPLDITADVPLAIREKPTDLQPEAEAPAPAKAPGFYHPELDGLRFFAFMGVYVFHAFPVQVTGELNTPLLRNIAWVFSALLAGEAGVDLFFVLSSYLITTLLLREFDRFGDVDLRKFYIRRTLRIWPLYYGFLIVAWFAEPVFFGHRWLASWHTLPFLAFLGNWALVAEYPFRSTAIVLWTVSIEEQFYLTWPWLVRWLRPRNLLGLSLALLVIAQLTRGLLVLQNAAFEEIHFNTFARLDGIALGALCACLFHRHGIPQIRPLFRSLCVAAGIWLWILAVRYCHLEQVLQPAPLFRYPLMAGGSLLIFLGCLQPASQPRTLWAWPPFVFLGRISYGLYVWHYLALGIAGAVIGQMSGTRPPLLQSAVWGLGLTILLAISSYFVLERPCLRWKTHFARIASRPGG